MAQLRAVKSKEDWSLWASTAALRLQPTKGASKRALEAVRLTDDGVVPLLLTDREATGAMGAAMVAKVRKIQSRSVAVYGPPSSIRPELAGMSKKLSLAVKKTRSKKLSR